MIEFELSYGGLAGVQQAHIHFAQAGVNGNIVAFLCTNLGNGPVGTPLCPASPATVSETLDAGDIVDLAAGQGIAAEDFAEVIEAIREGVSYVNVHTTTIPGGEIRGQIE